MKLKPRNHGKTWSKEDDNYITEKWGNVTVETMAINLGRTEIATYQRAKTLKLGSYREAGGTYISPLQIAELIGKSSGCIYYWIKTGKLPSRKRKREKRNIHQVDMEDLINFLKENQDLWDSRNLERYGLGEEPEWLKEKRETDIQNSQNKHKEPWSRSDDHRLLELYEEGLSADEIAEKLNRTKTSIIVRLSKRRRKGERIPQKKIPLPWTKEETEIMLSLEKQGYTDDEITYELGRERNHISYRRFKLRKNGEYEGFKYNNVGGSV